VRVAKGEGRSVLGWAARVRVGRVEWLSARRSWREGELHLAAVAM